MMTIEEFQQEKATLLARYGEAPREASGKRAQAFARLYAKSGWTQEQLAVKERLSQQRVGQLLVFGEFLACTTQGSKADALHEKQFRALLGATDKTQTKSHRFAAIDHMLGEERAPAHQKPDRQAVRRLSKQLIEQFADGKWHALRDMTDAVEADSIMVRGIMDRMVKEGTFQTFAERKSSGKGWYSYRMVKGGKKKIDLQVFQSEIAPALQEMERLVNEHHIHFSQGAMKMAVTKFRKVIDTLTR